MPMVRASGSSPEDAGARWQVHRSSSTRNQILDHPPCNPILRISLPSRNDTASETAEGEEATGPTCVLCDATDRGRWSGWEHGRVSAPLAAFSGYSMRTPK
jgi:hypothetical protein